MKNTKESESICTEAAHTGAYHSYYTAAAVLGVAGFKVVRSLADQTVDTRGHCILLCVGSGLSGIRIHTTHEGY